MSQLKLPQSAAFPTDLASSIAQKKWANTLLQLTIHCFSRLSLI